MAGPDLSSFGGGVSRETPVNTPDVPRSPNGSGPDLSAAGASPGPDLARFGADVISITDVSPRKILEQPGAAVRGGAEIAVGSLHAVSRKNTINLVRSIEDLASPTMLGKAWGALETVGSAFGWLASPAEWVFRGLLTPLGAFATGSRETGEKIGELGGEYLSFAAQVGLDPLAGAATLARKAAATKTAGQVVDVLSPATKTPAASRVGSVITERAARQANDYWAAHEQLAQWQGTANRLGPEVGFWQFLDAVERGQPVIPELQPLAETYRALMDDITARIQELGRQEGKNWLQQVRENYVGHVWKDPRKAAAFYNKLDEAGTTAASKRPLLGSRAFLKQRVYEYMTDARAAGLEPITTDPVHFMLAKYGEMNKFYHGVLLRRELRNTGLVQFKPWNARLPDKFVELDDPMWKVVAPPYERQIPGVDRAVKVLHEQAFDPALKRGLDKIAKMIGVDVRNPLRSQDPYLATHPRIQGYATQLPKEIANTFGSELQLYEHELGHHLDWYLGLSSYMHADAQAWRELGDLALLRAEESSRAAIQQSPDYLRGINRHTPFHPSMPWNSYILSAEERIANMFHAYWYAPELFKQFAPTAAARFDAMMNNTKLSAPTRQVLDAIKGVQKSLGTTSEKITETVEFHTDPVNIFVPGWRDMGKWVAPQDVARVFNNYVSAGLQGKPIFDGLRQTANAMNMAQLGLSFFHAAFTTIDTMISETARGLERAMHKEFGRAAVSMLAGLSPTTAFTTARRGRELRRAMGGRGWRGQAPVDRSTLSPEMQRMVEAVNRAGGRPQMDAYYRAADKGLFRSWRDGTFMKNLQDQYRAHPMATALKLPFKIAGAALQDISHPIMEYLVPAQKLGVFYNLAHDYLRRTPNASVYEQQVALQKIWASVDNRLGQMVYDNLFWDKVLKDIAFLTVRSVGWNLGTQRELGGAVVDAAKAIAAWGRGDGMEFTHRMAYAVAMPAVTAYYGAVLTYLYTGEPPRDAMDYFFPPTGRRGPRGERERVIIPSYIKDVLEYNREPVHTLSSKLNPLWVTLLEIYNNRDFYGGIIADPTQPVWQQGKEFTEYVANQFMPFSVRSAGRQEDPGQRLGSFFGFQLAPAWIANPSRGEAWQRRQDIRAIRRRERERSNR